MKRTDVVDEMLAAWERELPDQDCSALAIVGRVFVLAQRLEKRLEVVLAEVGLTLGQFDILATLRRHGPTGGLTPKQLLGSVMLTSGGMTSRLDGLEVLGYIARKPDPEDRRGVIIELTAKGRRKIEHAATVRFREARATLPALKATDLKHFTNMLRTWLLQLDEPR